MTDIKLVAHLGCCNEPLPQNIFPQEQWKETRVDIDAECRCDIVADICNMNMLQDNTFDAVYLSHVLEHFDCRTRYEGMKEWIRIAKPSAFIYFVVPKIDCKAVMQALQEGDVDKVIYKNESGIEITAAQLIYGQFYPSEYEIHRWGYTTKTLGCFLNQHLSKVQVVEQEFQLCAIGYK